MQYVGDYDKMKVYQLKRWEPAPTSTQELYVSYEGDIIYGGCVIGLLDVNSYKVKKYDKNIFYKWKAEKEREKKVPVLTCVAETTAVGKDGELTSTDEFFARVAKDIDDMLKSARNFNYEVEYQ